jgi:uncharacterized lipoprotein YddW (UPF0748 family)
MIRKTMIFIALNILFLFNANAQPIPSQKKTMPKKESSHDLSEDVKPASAPARNNKNAVQKQNPAKKGQKIIPQKVVVQKGKTLQELRGVWVSTVQNVDFPTKPTTDPALLKREWLSLLAFYKSLNLNAVIVQIRPTGDAIYPSKYAPYSKYLTGKSGKPLNGNFDLLQYMIETSHAEGIEFHGWVNPYRVIIDGDTTNLDAKHPFKAHRDWMLRYGREYLMNPGKPEVWQYLTKVMEEVVRKYDIDAIHFDDYFYPYRIAGEELPDTETFAEYGQNFENIDDWRRANTDSLICNVKNMIRRTKPMVQLGVSPFAVWRNKADDTEGSNTKAYQRCYEDLYANVLGWMRNGWLDYVAPEIYFHIGHPLVDYTNALDWWRKNSNGTTLYISHAIYKVNRQEKYPEWSDADEIPRQLALARSAPEVKGLVFFSSKWLIQNELGVTDALRELFFQEPADLPASGN